MQSAWIVQAWQCCELAEDGVNWDMRAAICCCFAIGCCYMFAMSSGVSLDSGCVGAVDASGNSFRDIMAV